MRITMLVSIIRRSVSCNLRRMAACVTYRNKMRTKIARQCNESNLLPISSPNITAFRIYSSKSDHELITLPMLVTGADMFTPSVITPFRLFFLSFMTIPKIDKNFNLSETLNGIKYATTVISKAIANENYDSLEGLVAEDMIEFLKTKTFPLTPEQRWLIAVNEEDIMLHFLCDIAATADEEHSIEIKTICHYIPEKAKKEKMVEMGIIGFINLTDYIVVGNYTFTRKYVNSDGSWIATFVNHYSSYIRT